MDTGAAWNGCGGGGHSNTSTVHMCDQRDVGKGSFFWDWTWFTRIAIRGLKMSVFKKKGPVWILLGSILEKILFGGKIVCEFCGGGVVCMCEFFLRGVFLQKCKFLLGYVLKISGHVFVQHWYMSAPSLVFGKVALENDLAKFMI